MRYKMLKLVFMRNPILYCKFDVKLNLKTVSSNNFTLVLLEEPIYSNYEYINDGEIMFEFNSLEELKQTNPELFI